MIITFWEKGLSKNINNISCWIRNPLFMWRKSNNEMILFEGYKVVFERKALAFGVVKCFWFQATASPCIVSLSHLWNFKSVFIIHITIFSHTHIFLINHIIIIIPILFPFVFHSFLLNLLIGKKRDKTNVIVHFKLTCVLVNPNAKKRHCMDLGHKTFWTSYSDFSWILTHGKETKSTRTNMNTTKNDIGIYLVHYL